MQAARLVEISYRQTKRIWRHYSAGGRDGGMEWRWRFCDGVLSGFVRIFGYLDGTNGVWGWVCDMNVRVYGFLFL